MPTTYKNNTLYQQIPTSHKNNTSHQQIPITHKNNTFNQQITSTHKNNKFDTWNSLEFIVLVWILIPPLPSKPKSKQFFRLPPGTLKLNKSPKETKSPGNSNMFHMVTNNTYNDFKTIYKRDLIPTYVIRVI